MALKARQNRESASLIPWSINDVEAQWLKDGDTAFPVGTEAVSSAQVLGVLAPRSRGHT